MQEHSLAWTAARTCPGRAPVLPPPGSGAPAWPLTTSAMVSHLHLDAAWPLTLRSARQACPTPGVPTCPRDTPQRPLDTGIPERRPGVLPGPAPTSCFLTDANQVPPVLLSLPWLPGSSELALGALAAGGAGEVSLSSPVTPSVLETPP